MPEPSTPIPADEVALPPVAERFCRYARIDTTPDPESATVPSTERQTDLARLLVSELRGAGAEAAGLDDAGYVYATLPSPLPADEAAALPAVGLVAHMDTSPDAPGAGVRPHVTPAWDGAPLVLPGDPSVVLDPAERPALAAHVGHDLLTSDGTTLLGSDDKAGVAVVMQLAEDLLRAESEAVARGERPAARPELRLLFTPDEEIGRGTDHVDLERWGADVAYTLDGSGTDTINVETFHAAEARVTVQGVGVHPGYAEGVMVNAVRLAADFVAALPAELAPETTSGRVGYLHPHELSGDVERAEVRVLLRDFDADGLAAKRELVRALANRLQAEHPRATVAVEVRESYRNMLAYIEASDPRVIAVADEAAARMGLTLAREAVRGGTDGARLSELGVPTPNVFTGGHDFHSRFEWNTVQNLERSLAFTHHLVRAWGAAR